jgi:hypothetical protein
VVSDEVAGLIRQRALELSRKFGGCPDLPIVYSEDFRKNFCRLVVALAVLDLSTDEEFNVVTVLKYHVEFMATFLDSIYSANNCRLDAYAKQYRDKHGLEDPDGILLEFEMYMSKSESVTNRICFIINELLQIDPIGTEKISQKYFMDQLGISSRTTLFKDMAPLVKYKLVSSSRGYKPTTKLFQLVNYVDKYRPGFFDLTSMDFGTEANS